MLFCLRVVPHVAILAVLMTGTASADWMNLTGAETAPNIAEITIHEDRVQVVLEAYIGNLDTFEDLIPDDLLKRPPTDRPSLAERLKRFSSETLQVLTDEGVKLQAELKLVEPRLRKDRTSPFAGMINPMTRQRVPDAPKDKRVLYAELDYPFERKPATLTFIPPQDDRGNTAVTIGFIAYHKAVPVIDFRYLSGAATVKLDWDDPWYSKFANPNLKRHHKSALMSFLYVEPREVRHEVLIRVRDLQKWTDLGLGHGTTIGPVEQARIKEHASAFFTERNSLSVDGAPATPGSTRAEFLRISLSGLEVIEEEKPLDLSTAMMGIILSYPIKHLPNHVSVKWELFDDRADRIPATAIDPAGPFVSSVERGDPVLEWNNYLVKYEDPKVSPAVLDDGRSLGIPVVTVLFAALALGAAALAMRPRLLSRGIWIGLSAFGGVAAILLVRVAVVDVAYPFRVPPEDSVSAEILTLVLNNVNHAYFEKDPTALRRELAKVVAQDSIGDVQAELGRALAIKVAGGGIARVKEIGDLTMKDVTVLQGRRGFRSLAEWTAKVTGGHWGHIHRRTIRFRALVELVEDNGAWKLAGITVVDAKQQG